MIQLVLKVTTDVTAEMKADQFISHFHKKITITLLFECVADGSLRKITQRTQPRFNEPSPVKTKAADKYDKYVPSTTVVCKGQN